MTVRKTEIAGEQSGLADHSPANVAILLAGVVAPIAAVVWLVPAGLVVPAFAVLSISMSVLVGLYAWWRREDGRAAALTTWDIAAAFMLVGCVSALLSDPQGALQLVGEIHVDP